MSIEDKTFEDIVAELKALGCSVTIVPKDITTPVIVCRVSKTISRDLCFGEGRGDTLKTSLVAAVQEFVTNCTSWYTTLSERASVAEQLSSDAGEILE